MRYKKNDQLDGTGSSLLKVIDNQIAQQIIELFGYPTDTSWQDEQKGYQYHMIIEDTKLNTIITFYDRYGIWRLGGYDKNIVIEFLNWIEKMNRAYLKLD
jgi:hypothetical protein